MPKYLSQRDPLWCNDKIGSSQLTLGKWGCALTSLIMGHNFVTGSSFTPKQIAHNVALFTPDGLVLWDRVCMFLGGKIKFNGTQTGEDKARIDMALKDPNQFVVWSVNKGAHFVLGCKKDMFGRYICIDPWTGEKCDVKKVYNDISGSRFFIRK